MGIKSFFQNLGRGIKKGFNSFISSVGGGIGQAGEYLQRKAIPAIANISNQVAGGIGKAMPVIAGVAPELAGPAEEAQNVLSKVGSGVGQFAKFIGSDVANQPVKVANAQQIAEFQQSPLGMAFRRSQTKAPAPAPAPASAPASAPAPAPALISDLFKNIPKGLISPAPSPLLARAPLGSNPNTYTPQVSSGIEAPPSTATPNIIKVDSGVGGTQTLKM